jgi:hypothetical protein
LALGAFEGAFCVSGGIFPSDLIRLVHREEGFSAEEVKTAALEGIRGPRSALGVGDVTRPGPGSLKRIRHTAAVHHVDGAVVGVAGEVRFAALSEEASTDISERRHLGALTVQHVHESRHRIFAARLIRVLEAAHGGVEAAHKAAAGVEVLAHYSALLRRKAPLPGVRALSEKLVDQTGVRRQKLPDLLLAAAFAGEIVREQIPEHEGRISRRVGRGIPGFDAAFVSRIPPV